jgi:CheY-like chemotaxis protein/HPt (histidine-containing phosphotransfer) domain-containing protein
VADTGIGIPLDKQETIFQAFTQADASVTRKYGGTGLGLAISSKLCQLMGGDIWVESSQGRGSQFHFAAGFALQPVSSPDEACSRLKALRSERILVVDDNVRSSLILCELLSNWRLEPTRVSDAPQAMSALRASTANGKPFRIVLLDAQMPGTDGFALAKDIQQQSGRAPSIIMMLSSAGSSDEIRQCHEAGIDTYLVKPIGQSELLNAILYRLGVADSYTEAPLSPPLATPRTGRPLDILVAEDNAVNRELATTVLRKLGHNVVVASNGQQALDLSECDNFDLILMDVQMPEMGGIEATMNLRRREKESGATRHVPIIGLTAHAMKGDREHALAAGMNEYVTKPLRVEDLSAAIERWLPRLSAPAADGSPQFDASELLRSLGGDHPAALRLVGLFLETTPPLVERIRHALENRDAATLVHAAHALKGSLTQLVETKSLAAVSELERMARAGTFVGTPAQLAELERNLAPFEARLRSWLTIASSKSTIIDPS